MLCEKWARKLFSMPPAMSADAEISPLLWLATSMLSAAALEASAAGMAYPTMSGRRAARVRRPRLFASTRYQRRPSIMLPSMAPRPTRAKRRAKRRPLCSSFCRVVRSPCGARACFFAMGAEGSDAWGTAFLTTFGTRSRDFAICCVWACWLACLVAFWGICTVIQAERTRERTSQAHQNGLFQGALRRLCLPVPVFLAVFSIRSVPSCAPA